MSSEKLEAILENEKEWRRHLLGEVKKIQDDMTLLKIKVATVASFFGVISGAVTSFIVKLLNS